jgi:anion-transporting  ArsA/GET3 family ATPase
MLDAKAGWDDLVRRSAPDVAAAERLLRNPLYQNITARFVNSHDYIAMERLYELSSNANFDVVVVDTPPSRNALDFLNAPDRMAEFFGGRLVRWLTIPYRNRFVGLASRPFFQVADRILGARFLTDIIEFFVLLQALEEGFVERARLVRALLDSPECDYVVVTSPGADSVREANYLLDHISGRTSQEPTVIVNRTMPCPTESGTESVRVVDVSVVGDLAARTGCDSASVERVLAAIQLARRAQTRRCSEHAEVCHQLSLRSVRVIDVPDVAVDAVAVVDQIAQSLIAK